MKQKSRARLSETDAYYLPGLFGDDEISPPPASGDGGDALLAKSKGYWVRRSEKQKLDKLGRPAGFRYVLMLGGRGVEAGTGSTFRRRFLRMAAFLNSKQPRPHPCRPQGAAAAENERLCRLARLTPRRCTRPSNFTPNSNLP